MPWKELSEMDAKMGFVADCLRGEEPMTVLCERHGISRQTGYLWKRRYALEGPGGLEERLRAPHRLAHSTAAEIVEQLIALREKHPYWGVPATGAVAPARCAD